jgi:hypothetical protein
MPNFSIANHTLSLTSNFSTLEVYDSDPSLVDSFDLSDAHRVRCTDGNYVVEGVEMPSGFVQHFVLAQEDTFGFLAEDGIGISDLRTVRSQFSYHLDECPVVLQCVDEELLVQSPCTGACSAPSAACCDIEPV